MPSIQQINDTKTHFSNEKNKSKIKSVLLWILFVMAVIVWYVRSDMPKVVTISEDTWSTRNDGKFKELFEDPYKKIIWFGSASCPYSPQKVSALETAIKYKNLDKYYIHHPYLQNSISVRCEKKDCMDMVILNNCSEGFCIIIPRLKKIIHTKSENLFRDAEKYKQY